jgi:hypothetical protein
MNTKLFLIIGLIAITNRTQGADKVQSAAASAAAAAAAINPASAAKAQAAAATKPNPFREAGWRFFNNSQDSLFVDVETALNPKEIAAELKKHNTSLDFLTKELQRHNLYPKNAVVIISFVRFGAYDHVLNNHATHTIAWSTFPLTGKIPAYCDLKLETPQRQD